MAGPLRGKVLPIYAPLFGELFDRPEVVETRATCESCAMCDQGQIAPVAMDYFRPDTKCCTYHPSLSNYLVGGILADTSEDLAEGRRRIQAKIATRIGVTPRWVAAPRKWMLLYVASRLSGVFGRSKVMLCPYFDQENDGRCTVWKYREAVCSTYFCKYTDGKPGWAFWDRMKSYLTHVEMRLAHYAMTSIDPTLSEPKMEPHHLTVEDIEDLPPKPEDYERFWGKWVGREEEFYVACYEKVRALDRPTFEKNIDDSADGRSFLAQLTAKYEAITERGVPKRLMLSPTMKTRETENAVVVTSYNPFDAFSVEKDLYKALTHIKADETLEQNLAQLDKEHGVQLEPDLVQYLFTHGVLVSPDELAAEEKAAAAAAQAVAPKTPASQATPKVSLPKPSLSKKTKRRKR